MRRFLLATAAALVISTPAVARDGSPYVGIEGGLLWPKNVNVNGFIDFTDPAVADVATTRAARAEPAPPRVLSDERLRMRHAP